MVNIILRELLYWEPITGVYDMAMGYLKPVVSDRENYNGLMNILPGFGRACR
jgi:hypothetical protein